MTARVEGSSPRVSVEVVRSNNPGAEAAVVAAVDTIRASVAARRRGPCSPVAAIRRRSSPLLALQDPPCSTRITRWRRC